MKGLFIPGITAEMFRNGCLESIEALMSEGKIFDIDTDWAWIPVSEMLPKEEKETYWVCTDAGTQCECRWTNINHIWTDLTTNWHWHICDIPKYTKVVAWMELPEPYQNEVSE